jgi:hypothetical protein
MKYAYIRYGQKKTCLILIILMVTLSICFPAVAGEQMYSNVYVSVQNQTTSDKLLTGESPQLSFLKTADGSTTADYTFSVGSLVTMRGYVPGSIPPPSGVTILFQRSEDGVTWCTVHTGETGADGYLYFDYTESCPGIVYYRGADSHGLGSADVFSIEWLQTDPPMTCVPIPKCIQKKYSMTRVFLDSEEKNAHARYVSDTVHAQYEYQNLETAFRSAGWGSPVFDETGTDVTPEDFGTDGSGLSATTLHWHNGHGWYDPNKLFESGLELVKNDGSLYGTSYILTPDDVVGKWDKENKWIVLESCLVLKDPRWNRALGTTHGILGFTTGTQTRSTLPTSFLKYANDEKMPISQAWQTSTQETFNRVTVPDYLQDPNTNIQMRAGVRFDTIEQYNNDHLPDSGTIEPDALIQEEHKFLDWPCSKGG